MAATDTPSAFTTPIVVGNLPEGVTEEMMMEDIRAATGIRVRAQAAGPPISGPAASSTDGFNPDQLREHTTACEAQTAGSHSPTFTEEFERRLAGQLDEDRRQRLENDTLMNGLHSHSPSTEPAPAAPEQAPAEQQRTAEQTPVGEPDEDYSTTGERGASQRSSSPQAPGPSTSASRTSQQTSSGR